MKYTIGEIAFFIMGVFAPINLMGEFTPMSAVLYVLVGFFSGYGTLCFYRNIIKGSGEKEKWK